LLVEDCGLSCCILNKQVFFLVLEVLLDPMLISHQVALFRGMHTQFCRFALVYA
jgi:hypothetical protein